MTESRAPIVPPVAFCPFCGASQIKFVRLVPRCCNPLCRAVFHVSFSRRARKSAP